MEVWKKLSIPGFEDRGKRECAKESEWPLRDGKGKEIDSLLEPLCKNHPTQHLDLSPEDLF